MSSTHASGLSGIGRAALPGRAAQITGRAALPLKRFQIPRSGRMAGCTSPGSVDPAHRRRRAARGRRTGAPNAGRDRLRRRARLHRLVAQRPRAAHLPRHSPRAASACSRPTSAGTAARPGAAPRAPTRSTTSRPRCVAARRRATRSSRCSAGRWAGPRCCGTPGSAATPTPSSASAHPGSGSSAAPGRCGWCTGCSRAAPGAPRPAVLRRTRLSPAGWTVVPEAPAEVAGAIAPRPLLIVHGEADHYFPRPSRRGARRGRPERRRLDRAGHGSRRGRDHRRAARPDRDPGCTQRHERAPAVCDDDARD